MALLALLALATAALASPSVINVALHAQSRYRDHQWVAGSEITTTGIKNALEQYAATNTNADALRHASGLAVGRVAVFAPFAYEGLLDGGTRWDLVLVEGWTGPVPAFLRAVRAASPRAKIVHYCLDTYPALARVLTLDVDGFLTNSARLLPRLRALGVPAARVDLAADPAAMRPVPPAAQYAHPVVYLGQFKATKHNLTAMLLEASPFGLAIYGNGWGVGAGGADLARHWRR